MYDSKAYSIVIDLWVGANRQLVISFFWPFGLADFTGSALLVGSGGFRAIYPLGVKRKVCESV